MNLKDNYANIKNKGNKNLFIELFEKVMVIGVCIYVMHTIWNYIAPVWGLPIMSILKFSGTYFFLYIFLSSVSSHFKPRIANNRLKVMDLNDIINDMDSEQ